MCFQYDALSPLPQIILNLVHFVDEFVGIVDNNQYITHSIRNSVLKVFSSEDRFLVTHIQTLLQGKGIPCFLKNEFAIGAAGDLSPFDCWPEVWITDDEWLPKAQALIEDVQKKREMAQAWRCHQCGEENDASFELCWHCGVELN